MKNLPLRHVKLSVLGLFTLSLGLQGSGVFAQQSVSTMLHPQQPYNYGHIVTTTRQQGLNSNQGFRATFTIQPTPIIPARVLPMPAPQPYVNGWVALPPAGYSLPAASSSLPSGCQPVWPSYPTIVLISGIYFPAYSDDYIDQYSYPSIYSGYDGLPNYIYVPDDAVIISPPPTVYTDGQFYLLSEHPDLGDGVTVSLAPGSTIVTPNGYYQTLGADSTVIQPVNSTLTDISNAWQGDNFEALNRHLDGSDRIQVGLGSKYAYSVGTSVFGKITKDAMATLRTTNFRFTSLTRYANGNFIAYAKHSYSAPGAAQNRIMYLAYKLSRDPSLSSSYRIAGVTTSRTPFTVTVK